MTRAIYLLIAIVLVASICSVNGQVYISPFGNDQNPGNVDLPFQTISKALTAIKSGGTIYMMSGFYTGTKNFGLTVSTVNITFSNYLGSSPVVSCGSVSGSSGFILSYPQSTYTSLTLNGVGISSCTYATLINNNYYGTQTLNFTGSSFLSISAALARCYSSSIVQSTLILYWSNAVQNQNSLLNIFSSNIVPITVYLNFQSLDFVGGSLLVNGIANLNVANCSFSNMDTAISLSLSSLWVSKSSFSQVRTAININLARSKSVQILDSTFTGNGPNTPVVVNGLSNSDASAIIQGSLFSNNAATSGAGGVSMLNCNSGGVFGIQSTSFSSNSGTVGGVDFQNSIVNLDGVSFTSNNATANGGGFNAAGTTLFGSSITFSKNYANGTLNSYNCQKNGTVGSVQLVGGNSDAPSTGNCGSNNVQLTIEKQPNADKLSMLLNYEVSRIQFSNRMSWAEKKQAYQALLQKLASTV